MMQLNNNTPKRCFKHLSLQERTLIQAWKSEGLSNREIGRRLHRSHQTIANELKRGTTTQLKTKRKQYHSYFPETGQAVYDKNRKKCGAKSKRIIASEFLMFACEQIKKYKWSPDAIIGFIKQLPEWKNQPIVCTKTLYNYIDAGFLPVRNIDLLVKTRLSLKKKRVRKQLKLLGESIDNRPEEINTRQTFGHWEIDSVLGRKTKDDNAILTLVERKTRYMLTLLLDDQTADSVNYAIEKLKKQFGIETFNQLFQSITADNGSEFSSLNSVLQGHTNVYFAHPYSSWERGTNERHNGLLRRFVPKGTPIANFSNAFIESLATQLNLLPRKKLNYKQPLQVFAEELQKLKSNPRG